MKRFIFVSRKMTSTSSEKREKYDVTTHVTDSMEVNSQLKFYVQIKRQRLHRSSG